MLMKKWNIPLCRLLLLVFFLNCCYSTVISQERTFKKYTNKTQRFSFDMPANWAIKYNAEGESFVCVPLVAAEKAKYVECFEGVVFRMEYFKASIDSILQTDGLYRKKGDVYFTSDRVNDSVEVELLKGKNWKGFYHNNICGISCNESGFHAAAGQCAYLYFSNGKTTVLINTSGNQLESDVLKRLISSFNFY